MRKGGRWRKFEFTSRPIDFSTKHNLSLFLCTCKIHKYAAQTSPAADGSFRLDAWTRSLKPRQAAFACRSTKKTTTAAAAECCAAQTAGNRQQAAAPSFYCEISDGKINFIWFTEQKPSERRRVFLFGSTLTSAKSTLSTWRQRRGAIQSCRCFLATIQNITLCLLAPSNAQEFSSSSFFFFFFARKFSTFAVKRLF